MTSHVMDELKGLKKSLSNAIKDTSNDERVFDMLSELEDRQVTAEHIRKLKLGNLVNDARKKFEEVSERVTKKALSILSKWKRILTAASESAPTPSTSPPAQGHAFIEPARFVTDVQGGSSSSGVRAAFSEGSSGNVDEYMIKLSRSIEYLTSARRAVFNVLFNSLKEGLPSGAKEELNAKELALNVEDELDLNFSSSRDAKQYAAKARTLAFNLKKNKSLREDVLNGGVKIDQLIRMTPQELASAELKSARLRQNEEVIEGRRLDWLEANREQIQQTLNLDPSNVWEYDANDEALSEPDLDPDP